MRTAWLCLTLLAFEAAPAQEASLRFEEANALYRSGDFQKAAAVYESILSNGYEHPALYYNLGNAYFKLQNIPASILNYERARRLSPRDEDIIHNLRLANLRVLDKIEPLPQLFIKEWWNALISFAPAGTWAVWGIAALWLAALAGALFLMVRSGIIQRLSFAVSFVAVLFCVFSFIGMAQQLHKEQSEQEAVVFSQSVSIKSAPDAGSVDLFVLHEGVKVELLDNVGDWRKIRLPDGKIGWVPGENIQII